MPDRIPPAEIEEQHTREQNDREMMREQREFILNMKILGHYRMGECTFPVMLGRLEKVVRYAMRLRADLTKARERKRGKK